MNFSKPFIHRPVATTLLTLGLALAGIISFYLLPVSALPRIDFPTILVTAKLPGADPETMATAVAAPLEKKLGHIAGVTEMTSASNRGYTYIVVQFDLGRDIDGAARDVQGGDQCRSGGPPDGSRGESDLPQGQSLRGPGPDPRPDLRFRGPAEDVRCGLHHSSAEVVPSGGRRPCLHRRRIPSGPPGWR